MRRVVTGAVIWASVFWAVGVTSPSRAAEAVEVPPQDVLKLRDPFRRPEAMAADEVKRTELETIPIDQFKMVGVVMGPRHTKAMLVASNGKSYFVSTRTRIGVRQGVVTKITPEYVKVVEKVVNVLGQEEDVESILKLPPDYINKAVAGP